MFLRNLGLLPAPRFFHFITFIPTRFPRHECIGDDSSGVRLRHKPRSLFFFSAVGGFGSGGLPMSVERHYTTAQAAELLSCHVRTIRNWVQAGKLAPVVLVSARDWRIPESVLAKFLKDREVRYA
jgi:excisionase family DNA binding protein